MHKQNRDDDPAVHSFRPSPNARKHSLNANKNPSSATGQLLVGKVAPTPKHQLARRLCLLVDWLHPPLNSLSSQSVPSLISNAHSRTAVVNPLLTPRKSHETRPTKAQHP